MTTFLEILGIVIGEKIAAKLGPFGYEIVRTIQSHKIMLITNNYSSAFSNVGHAVKVWASNIELSHIQFVSFHTTHGSGTRLSRASSSVPSYFCCRFLLELRKLDTMNNQGLSTGAWNSQTPCNINIPDLEDQTMPEIEHKSPGEREFEILLPFGCVDRSPEDVV
ncbi:hypothetical protein M422DRAFT_44638 [Sphaerobolus stellatus SS14]|nr:hypothetical protein M422DRAFT_44638 [Sphaerobolus stellatus SS14]